MRGGKVLTCFGLFWSALTLLFDGFILVPAVRQVVALRFESTEGRIIASEVTRSSSGDGDTFGVKVSYSYAVSGRELVGNRYRYDTSTTSDSDWARRAVADRPPGKLVRVYYDPANPQNSVLQRGIAGSDLFLAMFITPFNVVMLTFWWAGWSALRQKWLRPPAGGVKLISELRRTRARLTPFSPLGLAVAAVGLLAFLSTFVVGFGFGGFHPPWRVMLVTWLVIFTGATVVGVWHWVKILSGKYDLILDEMNGSLQLPLTRGRKTRLTIPLAKVQSVFVHTIEKQDGEGGTSSSYVPMLRIGEGGGTSEQLVEWHDVEKARGFVEWLNEKLPPRKSNYLRPKDRGAADQAAGLT